MLYIIERGTVSKSRLGGDGLTIVNNGVLGLVFNAGTNFGTQIGLVPGGMGSAVSAPAIGK